MLPLKMLQIVLPFFITILEPVKPQVCQTCDQVITGRNYNYAEALQIIQDEEYLEDADFDEIRQYRYKRHTKSFMNHKVLGIILRI